MIAKLEISGVHYNVDADLKKYVNKKIGRMDRYVQRQARASMHAEIKLKENHAKDRKQCTCEVICHVPGETFVISETTLNMYAAVDIVEAKLKNQLKKYKEKRLSPRSGHKESRVRRMFGKVVRGRR